MKKKAVVRKNKPEPEQYTWGGAATGAVSGLTLGASLGSAVGPIGTAVGAVAGTVIGGVYGWISSEDEEAEKKLQEKQKATAASMNMYQNASSHNVMGTTAKYYYGGMAEPNAELEKKEVLKTPQGKVISVDAPSHADGGIKMSLPINTKIYSDRLKHINDNGIKESYAKTAARLQNKLSKYDDTGINDLPTKNTNALMRPRINAELDFVFAKQEASKPIKEFKNGGSIPKFPIGGVNPWDNEQYAEDVASQQLFAQMQQGTNAQSPYATQNTLVPNFNPSLGVVKLDGAGENITIPQNTNLNSGQPIEAGVYTPTQIKKSVADYSVGQPPTGNKSIVKSDPTIKTKSTVNTVGNIASTVGELAPMIYNLSQKNTKSEDPSKYMNTHFVEPQKMDVSEQLRDAERNYAAMVNDKSLPFAQRVAAAQALQRAKAGVFQGQQNQYRQDINQSQAQNANIAQSNIGMMKAIDIENDQDAMADKNSRSQAITDISKYVQNEKLESNMRVKNDYLKSALASAFPNFTFDSNGNPKKTDGTAVTAEELKSLQDFMNTLTALQNKGSDGFMSGYYNDDRNKYMIGK